jgi:hypothetical protein
VPVVVCGYRLGLWKSKGWLADHHEDFYQTMINVFEIRKEITARK